MDEPKTIESAISGFLTNIQEEHLKLLEEGEQVDLVLSRAAKQIESLNLQNIARQKREKSRFNIFDCLTKHHKEELHSNFIHYLLDPNGSHDFGLTFLRLFIEVLLEKADFADVLDSLKAPIDKATVIKEFHIGFSKDTDDYGRIDHFISMPHLNIALENKLNAPDQPDQLNRYANYCNSFVKPYIVLYLTIDGRKAMENCTSKYYSISYGADILSWLDKCLDATHEYPNVYYGIRYYRNMVKHSILNLPSNQFVMDIKGLLKKEENILLLNYAAEIREALDQVENELRVAFFEKVFIRLKERYACKVAAGIMQDCRLTAVMDDIHRGISFVGDETTLDITDTKSIHFCIEHDRSNLYFGLFGVESGTKGFDVTKEVIASSIVNRMQQLGCIDIEPFDGWWLASKYFQISDGVDFGDSSANLTLANELDATVDRFIVEIDNYLEAWMQIVTEMRSK